MLVHGALQGAQVMQSGGAEVRDREQSEEAWDTSLHGYSEGATWAKQPRKEGSSVSEVSGRGPCGVAIAVKPADTVGEAVGGRGTLSNDGVSREMGGGTRWERPCVISRVSRGVVGASARAGQGAEREAEGNPGGLDT